MKDVAAARPDAMDMITDTRKPTILKHAMFVFHEFLETVSVQLFIFDMVRLVLFHVGFVFECIIAGWPSAVEMCGPLSGKAAGRGGAIFRGSKSLKSFLDDGRILSMIIGVHLYVRGAYVNFITAIL